MKSKRFTFSVSRAFYERLSRYCAEHDVSMASVVDQVVNEAMGQPYVERPLPPRPETTATARPLTPRAAVYSCSVCGERGHNAAKHGHDYTIEVSPELYELLSDLRVRARELEGRDVTRGEILEQGIERVLDAGYRPEGRR